ncbi:MAG: single-stranded DNA-binding protein [Sphingobacteriales bacterium]|nr:single-stranded DNA-binding protein [Sphingobacteriales bacterium]
MTSLNRVMLIGRLGKEPEIQHFDSGVVRASFSLATSEVYINKDGQKIEQTEWHNIVMWRKLAEIAEKYLVKGKLVYIEGKLKTRSWDDKEGNKRYVTEIDASNMIMLGSPRQRRRRRRYALSGRRRRSV